MQYIEIFSPVIGNFSRNFLTFFFIFLLKTQIVGIRLNRLAEAVLTSTHNLCFLSKIRKKYRAGSCRKKLGFCIPQFFLYKNLGFKGGIHFTDTFS